MKDYLSIGSSPPDESCAQVGTNDYYEQSLKECTAFKHQLERIFQNKDGELPEGCYFSIKSFPHEFGTYREVVCYFDDDNEESSNFAFNVEQNTPDKWDKESKRELGLK